MLREDEASKIGVKPKNTAYFLVEQTRNNESIFYGLIISEGNRFLLLCLSLPPIAGALSLEKSSACEVKIAPENFTQLAP